MCIWLENQQWDENVAEVCLQGLYYVNLGEATLLTCLLFALHVRACTGLVLTGLLQGAFVD